MLFVRSGYYLTEQLKYYLTEQSRYYFTEEYNYVTCKIKILFYIKIK